MSTPDPTSNRLSRRTFIAGAGGTAGLVLAGCSGDGTPSAASDFGDLAPTDVDRTDASPTPVPTSAPAVPTGDRVLVVVQMGGGNDGLNTLVPPDGRYRDLRPTLAIPDDDLVALDGTDYALHPSLAPLAPRWNAAQVAAVQAIGLPDQSRSHFVALDTWWAGQPGGSSGGWLGRWMDETATTDSSPVRAVALGGGSPALLGQDSSPVIVQSLDGSDLRDRSRTGAVTDAFALMGEGDADGLLGRAQAAIPTTIEALDQIGAAIGPDRPAGDAYGGGDTPALFGAAADIIDADIGTQVILVNIGGYDTHANQLGTHAGLLEDLGTGIDTLFSRLEVSGNDLRTLVMTYSEFGRRVAENASGGTDHGNGGLAFLVGPSVNGGQVVGELDLVGLDRGDVAQSVDARSLYANALDWLGGPTDDVLEGTWDRLSLLA